VFFVNLSIDLAYLDNFVLGLGQPNLEDLSLELSQLVELLISQVPEEFLDKTVRMRKYPRVDRKIAIMLFDK